MKINNDKALARLAAIQQGQVPTPPMWQTVPLTLVSFTAGHICMTTQADERHLNALGSVHGGFAATALDTVLGLAVYTSIGADARHTTVDLGVKVVKRLPLHTTLKVESELVHVSRSVGVAQAVMRDEAGTVYAHGTTTCLIQRLDPGAN